MLSFKKFITEKLRDRKTATKVLNRVYKSTRYNKMDNSLRKGYGDNMTNVIPWTPINTDHLYKGEKRINYGHFKDAPVHKVPLNKVVSNQESVSRSVVSKKIQGKWPDHNPDIPYYILHNGQYHIFDGNHQSNRERYRGRKHILAKVVVADSLREP